MRLDTTLAPVALEVHGSVQLPQRLHDFLEDGGEQEKVHEIGIELRAATLQNDLRCRGGVSSRPVSPSVRDRVIGVGDAHDASAERNLRPRQAARITTSIPTFVMAKHPLAEIGIEPGKWFEHLSAPLRMRGDQLPFAWGQLATFPNDIEQRRMNFSNVVEERDAFHASAFVLIEIRGARQDQRVGGNTSQVSARFMVVRVDRVEQCLESGGSEAFSGAPGCQLASGEDAADRTHGDSGEGAKQTLFLRHWGYTRQELGDMTGQRGGPTVDE